jgi:Ser/Thr protein kinase RdoA (MazF antagonist)
MLAAVAALGRLREHTLEWLARAPNVVIAVELDGGPAVVSQRFGSPRAFAQACAALEWFAGREQLGGARIARALRIDAAARVLVVERLPGARAPTNVDGHRAAGRFLAALHALALPDPDPLPLAEALRRRHRAWRQACGDRLTPEQLRVVDELCPTAELFADVRRVPCHRDFTPDNWLWDGQQLAVVDFEHARLDLAVGDLAKLAVGVWSRAPRLATAFFDGYGSPLGAADCTRLRHAVVLHGLASLAWGWRHAAARFVDEGQRALALAQHWPTHAWDCSGGHACDSSMMEAVPELAHEDVSD